MSINREGLVATLNEVKYDNKFECRNCGGENDIVKTVNEEFILLECETFCKTCLTHDYWAYGYFVN